MFAGRGGPLFTHIFHDAAPSVLVVLYEIKCFDNVWMAQCLADTKLARHAFLIILFSFISVPSPKRLDSHNPVLVRHLQESYDCRRPAAHNFALALIAVLFMQQERLRPEWRRIVIDAAFACGGSASSAAGELADLLILRQDTFHFCKHCGWLGAWRRKCRVRRRWRRRLLEPLALICRIRM